MPETDEARKIGRDYIREVLVCKIRSQDFCPLSCQESPEDVSNYRIFRTIRHTVP